jgi:hypothetical protein
MYQFLAQVRVDFLPPKKINPKVPENEERKERQKKRKAMAG